jgi:hypothetical protein
LTTLQIIFYLPHMEYEGSIGFVTGKMKFFIVDFHVFGLFIAKKHDRNFFSSVTRRRGSVVTDKKLVSVNRFAMWTVYTRPTCASDFCRINLKYSL